MLPFVALLAVMVLYLCLNREAFGVSLLFVAFEPPPPPQSTNHVGEVDQLRRYVL